MAGIEALPAFSWSRVGYSQQNEGKSRGGRPDDLGQNNGLLTISRDDDVCVEQQCHHLFDLLTAW